MAGDWADDVRSCGLWIGFWKWSDDDDDSELTDQNRDGTDNSNNTEFQERMNTGKIGQKHW